MIRFATSRSIAWLDRQSRTLVYAPSAGILRRFWLGFSLRGRVFSSWVKLKAASEAIDGNVHVMIVEEAFATEQLIVQANQTVTVSLSKTGSLSLKNPKGMN